jgi:phosphoribosylformimino-5-aminoimidazole carboxamide ribotide isomerase
MQLVPVLEIQHGKCVHTEHKNAFADHIISHDPLEIVNLWVKQGIQRIHFVDVDGIKSGEPSNVDLLSQIKKQLPNLCIQVTAGIKNVDSAFIWMDAGADYLILTSRALQNKGLLTDICLEFPNKVLVELDSKHGLVNIGAEQSYSDLVMVAKELEDDGVIGLVVTDIPAKGHVHKESLLTVNKFSQAVGIPVFANGGIDNMDDLRALLESHAESLTGVILGKVIYRESFCLSEAQEMLNEFKVAC